MDNAGQIAIEPPQVSEVTERRIHDAASEHMMRKTTQEELRAATNATLRAQATSDEAKALVARRYNDRRTFGRHGPSGSSDSTATAVKRTRTQTQPMAPRGPAAQREGQPMKYGQA
jgi:hypothetical protein